MADKNTYLQLSQSVQHLSFLKELPETSEDEKAELETYLQDLASQQERKFDSIIGLLKKCDHYIDAYDKELAELKEARDSWKRNREKVIGIIKYAFQQDLITSKLNGERYQGTIAKVKSKLVDNFDQWDDADIKEFGLKKTTTLSRLKDDSVVEVKEESLPDKDRIRTAIEENNKKVPPIAQLVSSYSFRYGRRKRLTNS
jgi:hypothetical protein